MLTDTDYLRAINLCRAILAADDAGSGLAAGSLLGQLRTLLTNEKETTMSDLPSITNENELKTAINNATTPEQRAHAHKHAHLLDLVHHLPRSWNKDGTTKQGQ